MKRNSLFLTIFFWFMGAMLLMAVVTMGLTLLMARQGIVLTGRGDIMAQVVRERGMDMVERFEAEGHRGVMRGMRGPGNPEGLFLHLFDREGLPLTMDPMSRSLSPVVVRNLARDRTFFHVGDRAISIQRITSASGREYVLAGVVPVSPPWRFLGRNPTEFWIRLSGLVITAGIFCYLLASYITRPVRELKNAARAIVDGDLSVRVDSKIRDRGDEIGELGESFDSMTCHVSSLLGAQNRLIRDISHELRSPLARLNVALALARQKAGEVAAGPLDRIERETENLNEMIGQLLSLSRLEADMGHVETMIHDLVPLVRHVAEDARYEAAHRGRTVNFTSPEEALRLSYNAGLIKSAVENVVRNAVRHTAEGTSVDVEALDRGENVLIRVADHGPGVPEEELEKLFLPFYRLQEARDRKSGGTGLGLAIAWRAVHLHGGDIAARNAAGGGLIVEITLPVAGPRAT